MKQAQITFFTLLTVTCLFFGSQALEFQTLMKDTSNLESPQGNDLINIAEENLDESIELGEARDEPLNRNQLKKMDGFRKNDLEGQQEVGMSEEDSPIQRNLRRYGSSSSYYYYYSYSSSSYNYYYYYSYPSSSYYYYYYYYYSSSSSSASQYLDLSFYYYSYQQDLDDLKDDVDASINRALLIMLLVLMVPTLIFIFVLILVICIFRRALPRKAEAPQSHSQEEERRSVIVDSHPPREVQQLGYNQELVEIQPQNVSNYQQPERIVYVQNEARNSVLGNPSQNVLEYEVKPRSSLLPNKSQKYIVVNQQA